MIKKKKKKTAIRPGQSFTRSPYSEETKTDSPDSPSLNDLIREKERVKRILQENKESICIQEAVNRDRDKYSDGEEFLRQMQGGYFSEYAIEYYRCIKETILLLLCQADNPTNAITRELKKRRIFFSIKGYPEGGDYKMSDEKVGEAVINEDFIDLLKKHCAGLYPRCRLLEAKKVKETEKYTFYRAKIEWNKFKRRWKFPKGMSGGSPDQNEEKTCFICVRNGTKTFALSYSLYLDNKTVKYLTKIVNNKFIKLFSKNL